ncbi:MAG: phosphoribosyl transferase [Acidobacteria bacterium]|nr:MAG: phosphoribosyl transferase [Acidobacteriota bacterium]
MVFKDRIDAGERLGESLANAGLGVCTVLALPRGGVPVAAGVAKALDAPLDVIVARKLGVPGHSELGFGAIAEGGVAVLNGSLVERLGITRTQIERVIEREQEELSRRVDRYRSGRTLPDLSGQTAVLVDDGLATGYTARAGLDALRRLGAERVLLAVPVGARETVGELQRDGYEVVCLTAPEHFAAVGQWYMDFTQTSDAEVLDLLGAPAADASDPAGSLGVGPQEVSITAGRAVLQGRLTIPLEPRGIVIFAHGSGSSRLSPRNIEVAEALNASGMATLLFDLLTPEEAGDRRNVFDIALLGERLIAATRWVGEHSALGRIGLPVFYFGASTGAAAALVAAAKLGGGISGVVSRGGRPDLAGDALPNVTAPVLLIVGGTDREVLELNRRAAALIRSDVELAVVPGAGHLFEEPGTLGEVSRLAAAYFSDLAEQSSQRLPG